MPRSRRARSSKARLASEYGAHLAILDQRLDDALRATGFDGAVIFAGDERVGIPRRPDLPVPRRAVLQGVGAADAGAGLVPAPRAGPAADARLQAGRRLLARAAERSRRLLDAAFRHPRRADRRRGAQALGQRRALGRDRLGGRAPRARRRRGHAARDQRSALPESPRLLRAVKTTYELLCMRGAQAMAVRGHLAVAAAFKSGATELELHQAYLAASGQRETELPYAQHHRLERARRDAALPAPARRGADRQALAADRRGRASSTATRPTSRAPTRRRRRRLRGVDRVDGRACSSASATR